MGHSDLSEFSFEVMQEKQDLKEDEALLEKFVFDLLRLPDVAVNDGPKGPQGKAIMKLFQDAKVIKVVQ